ncbi:DUF3566 domain-containing protein [Pseudofrankia sp. BMG5.36]|uniref:DUF3566 domain-containing protein n=1 Tax=Pseudofrankia sp. BMG5.36 TaxID=1834512 RepID=UPI0008DB2C8F|nr:DUF3566 domain-containing protein [Pseudofrankia sp. BMG5.36]OHV44424.1 hypothetical protein BCD48_02535 [Pseudofrankia sp. BMG5.36]
MSDKDERPGRSGALPGTATDGENPDPSAGNPFFERQGSKTDADTGRPAADATPARTATKTPTAPGAGSGSPEDDKTAVVRAVAPSSAPATAKKNAAKTTTLDTAPAKAPPASAATTTVATPVAPPPLVDKGGSHRADRSEPYAATGRGAPAKPAGADQQAQPPRDPDTMAIVRNPARGPDKARDTSRDARARGGDVPERAERDRPGRSAPRPERSDRPATGADTRKVAAVAAPSPDPDRTRAEPAKPDLAKPSRGPAVPAERVPAPTSGSRPLGPAGGPGPDRGRPAADQEWARPPRADRQEPGGVAGPPGPPGRPGHPAHPVQPGRYDRPEPVRQDYQDDYLGGEDDLSRAGRRAKLRLTRVSPLTVTRLAFAFSLCVFLVVMVAIAVLWFVLNSIGVFDSIVEAAGTLTTDESSNVGSWLSFGRAMQISLLIGAINVILITLLSTLGALLYNLCSDMIGGIEVTLSDR